jgi:hypothetical protein
VHGAPAKEWNILLDEETTFGDILWFNVVADVDDMHVRIDGEDHALHDPDVRVLQTEISEQRYHFRVCRKT